MIVRAGSWCEGRHAPEGITYQHSDDGDQEDDLHHPIENEKEAANHSDDSCLRLLTEWGNDASGMWM